MSTANVQGCAYKMQRPRAPVPCAHQKYRRIRNKYKPREKEHSYTKIQKPRQKDSTTQNEKKSLQKRKSTKTRFVHTAPTNTQWRAAGVGRRRGQNKKQSSPASGRGCYKKRTSLAQAPAANMDLPLTLEFRRHASAPHSAPGRVCMAGAQWKTNKCGGVKIDHA